MKPSRFVRVTRWIIAAPNTTFRFLQSRKTRYCKAIVVCLLLADVEESLGALQAEGHRLFAFSNGTSKAVRGDFADQWSTSMF